MEAEWGLSVTIVMFGYSVMYINCEGHFGPPAQTVEETNELVRYESTRSYKDQPVIVSREENIFSRFRKSTGYR